MHVQTSAKPVPVFVSFGSDTEQRWSSLKEQESTETLSSTRNALKTVRNSVNWSCLCSSQQYKQNSATPRTGSKGEGRAGAEIKNQYGDAWTSPAASREDESSDKSK